MLDLDEGYICKNIFFWVAFMDGDINEREVKRWRDVSGVFDL
jgi:hypothetical protein